MDKYSLRNKRDTMDKQAVVDDYRISVPRGRAESLVSQLADLHALQHNRRLAREYSLTIVPVSWEDTQRSSHSRKGPVSRNGPSTCDLTLSCQGKYCAAAARTTAHTERSRVQLSEESCAQSLHSQYATHKPASARLHRLTDTQLTCFIGSSTMLSVGVPQEPNAP